MIPSPERIRPPKSDRGRAALLLSAAILSAMTASSAAAQQSAAVVSGVVVDSLRTMEPLERTEVVLVGAGRSTTTDGEGRFTFRGVPPGSYSLSYWAPWLDSVGLPAIRREIQVADDDSNEVRLIVPPLPTVQTATCGAPLADGLGVLLGEVRDVNGNPAAGAAVRVLWRETRIGKGVLSYSEESLGTVTSASGWYVVCGVPKFGDRTIRVIQRQEQDTATLTADFNTSFRRRDIMVGSGNANATVIGRIVSEQGRPMEDASVSVAGRPTLTVLTTDGGTFSLTVPRQSVQLAIRAVGYVPLQIDVEPFADTVHMGEVRVARLPPLLASLLVTGRAISPEELDYEHRKLIGLGSYLDEAILNRAPVITPSFVVSQVPGAYTGPGGHNTQKIMLWKNLGPCNPRIFVDGWDLGHPDGLDQEMYLRYSKRIEVYRAAFAPVEFPDFGGCGSVVIWTR